MKIGILADSHDHLPAVALAAEAFRLAGVAQIIHAGDFVAPFALPPMQAAGVPVTAVLGNNDGERVGLAACFAKFGWQLQPKFAFATWAGVAVAVHHEPEPVEALARSGLYQVVVYGHTHELDLRRVGATLVINPGEAGGWLTGRRSAVVLDLETLQPQVIEL
jgi:putative phosphoesterase